MKRVVAAVIIIFAVATPAVAQEFNCTVSVNYSNLSGSDYAYLDELREEVREYMNLRAWTDQRFEEVERIDCTMQVILLEATTLTSFRARLIVASRRPIYGTTQQTTVTQFSDEEWRFNYAQGTPLIFDVERYHPMTSVLNFYAFVMLGFDFDSFAPNGGTPYFERARRIAEIAQSSGAQGWIALSGDRSRGELIRQILDSRFADLRRAYFDYHFGCLDHFAAKTDEARATMLAVIDVLQGLYDDVSRSYYLDQFFATKYQELAAVFQGSTLASQAFDRLSAIDPAHLSDYNTMMQ